MRRISRWHRVGVGVLAAALAGCAGTSCTDMGASSAVMVHFDDVVDQHPHQRLSQRTCVDDTCKEGMIRKSMPWTVFGERVVNDGDARTVSVTIRGESGDVVFEASQQVSPHKYQVNGRGCDPTTFNADVHLSGADEIDVSYPDDA